jgi:hypothetical protein
VFALTALAILTVLQLPGRSDLVGNMSTVKKA